MRGLIAGALVALLVGPTWAPFEQLAAAKALRLTIPPSVLARADLLIE